MKIKDINTTGTGDTFNVEFVFELSIKKPIRECLEFANKVAGISTTKLGAGDAMPFIKDIQSWDLKFFYQSFCYYLITFGIKMNIVPVIIFSIYF